MKKNDRLELFIEKLVFEGAGLARHENFPIFVDNVAPQEKVLAEIYSINKNYAKAKLVKVLEPSKSRVEPICAMANVCGGCCWQHVSYDEQLQQKKQIVQETIKKIAGEYIEIKNVIPSPQITEFRHKIQYPITQTKVSKRILAGYYKKNSHELVNIKHCPIQPKQIDEIIDFIREEAKSCNVIGYDETKHKGDLRHIVIRHSQANNEILVILVVNDFKLRKTVKALAQRVFDKFENIIGCLVNFNDKKTNSILGKETQPIIGKEYYTEKIGDKVYQVSAGSFFQVNPNSAKNILDTVKNIIIERVVEPEILDAYSGVGSFGIYLGDIAKRVVCVEDYPPATADAIKNIELNGYKNFEVLTGDAKLHLESLVNAKRQFDVVIVDPPRKGLAPEAVQTAAKLSKKLIIYVSCNPSTLARDLKLFKEYGYKTQYIQPVDMFCHTFHIENVALLEKSSLL